MINLLKILTILFLFQSCGYKTIKTSELIPQVNFFDNSDSFNHDLTQKRIYKNIVNYNLITADKPNYYCKINNISISQNRIALSANGLDSSYQLQVKIDYNLFDDDNAFLLNNDFTLMEIYEVDDSLYSTEVKNSEILQLLPKSFMSNLAQQIALLN
ncbi:MAG: hypothetical protein ISQ32_02300 [Rickettsiales bacterium]|nr:hypothetical protein [Rickettsiales bacterium]